MKCATAWSILATGAALLACAPVGMPMSPNRANLAAEVVRPGPSGPPKNSAGLCWASDVTPMVIETVSEQVMVGQEKRDQTGRLITPAAFRTETRQQIVQERTEIWFRSPCPEVMTVDFIASLQRALKARGLYLLPLSGSFDLPTRTALRRFQSERGLESDRLSLNAARELGLITTELHQL